MTVSPLIEYVVAALVLAGATFALLGSFGLAKLSDFYRRLHGPTKATTLGVGSVLIASSVYFTALTGRFSAHEFLISLFLFIAAPVAAHCLARAALTRDRIELEKAGRTSRGPSQSGSAHRGKAGG